MARLLVLSQQVMFSFLRFLFRRVVSTQITLVYLYLRTQK